MKVSTFQAGDMREALELVREELGPDAVVLSTRRVREKGKSGSLLGRPMIEVTAVPNPGGAEGEADNSAPAVPNAAGVEARAASVNRIEAGAATPRQVPKAPMAAAPTTEQSQDLSSIQNKLANLEKQVTSLPGQVAREVGKTPTVQGLDARGQKRYGWLLMHGVEEPIARKLALVERASKKNNGLEDALSRVLKFRDPLQGEARIVALVGPTGVGKTTTLAKIGADLILNRNKSVGFITLDTFRVGAVAQLETYARLLQVRLIVARSAAEVHAGVRSLARCDYILVDTVGSSPYNQRQVAATSDLLPVMGEAREVLLCMAGNVRETEQRAIFRRFKTLEPTGLIFTKLDETVSFGGILNVSLRAKLPLTFFTDGQRVPENLDWLSASKMARWFDQADA